MKRHNSKKDYKNHLNFNILHFVLTFNHYFIIINEMVKVGRWKIALKVLLKKTFSSNSFREKLEIITAKNLRQN